MNINEFGLNLIKSFEDCKLIAYKPVSTEKYWTIGYGHYGPEISEGMTITMSQAEVMLKKDIKKVEDGVKNCLTISINENQFSALVSFAFNCGLGNLKKSTLLKKVNARDFIGASKEFDKWNKSSGKVLSGLIRRRTAEKKLFLKPVSNELKLPYDVVTTVNLNIRTSPSTKGELIRTVPKDTVLRVWAECNNENLKWGKNGKEYFCLNYCKEL